MDQIITSTVLLIVMIGISAFFEKRMNPCIKYALWLIAAVKLLVPVPEFENAMNILNVVEKLQVEHTICEEFVTGSIRLCGGLHTDV